MISIYLIIVAVIAVVFAIMLIRTFAGGKTNVDNIEKKSYDVDKEGVCNKLSEAIQLKTVTSKFNDKLDKDEFLGFHSFLEKSFPNIHSVFEKTIVNEYSLLYSYKAKNPSSKPMVFMSHMDVVPISEKTIDEWEFAPFSGHVDEKYIWGRGALDMKGHLVAVCEAFEYCIKNEIEIKRDVYLSFGHDEESIGNNGTGEIIKYFEQNNINPEYVFDEGGACVDGKMLGMDGMLGLVGIAEKGYADITLEASDKGGHASQPPMDTAVSRIAEAITLLKKNQLPATMNKPLEDFISYTRPYMNFPLKFVSSNLWCFKNVLLLGFSKSNASRALTQTTFAPTMLCGSNASNVMAQKATVTINFRISPDDSLEKLVNHLEKTIKKTGVKIAHIEGHDPSKISDVNSKSFKNIEKSILEVIPGVNVCPYLVIATTDSRKFSNIADNVYRFSPFRSLSRDLGTIHANNERLEKDSLVEGVEFFIRLIENSNY